jgi:3-deoxy-manno-octulosonate cytidylyltransferase (CMP-KDO synthetase)
MSNTSSYSSPVPAPTVIVIPARQGSQRFPGKPLAPICGKTLLLRTWNIAKAVQGVDQVLIATDDEGIRKYAEEEMGAEVVLTRPECRNGSERVFEAVQKLRIRPEFVINLQGDAVLTPPWVIQSVVDKIQKDSTIQIATPATHLSRAQYEQFLGSKANGRTSGTLVVFDRKSQALYFSKNIIPNVREWKSEAAPLYRHIGLYAYRFAALQSYVAMDPSPLEEAEGLEQLRALENGIPIRIVQVDYRGRTHWSVDNPEDVGVVEKIIGLEGELV